MCSSDLAQNILGGLGSAGSSLYNWLTGSQTGGLSANDLSYIDPSLSGYGSGVIGGSGASYEDVLNFFG